MWMWVDIQIVLRRRCVPNRLESLTTVGFGTQHRPEYSSHRLKCLVGELELGYPRISEVGSRFLGSVSVRSVAGAESP